MSHATMSVMEAAEALLNEAWAGDIHGSAANVSWTSLWNLRDAVEEATGTDPVLEGQEK